MFTVFILMTKNKIKIKLVWILVRLVWTEALIYVSCHVAITDEVTDSQEHKIIIILLVNQQWLPQYQVLRPRHTKRHVAAQQFPSCDTPILMKNPCLCNRILSPRQVAQIKTGKLEFASGRSNKMTQIFPVANAVHTRRQVAEPCGT